MPTPPSRDPRPLRPAHPAAPPPARPGARTATPTQASGGAQRAQAEAIAREQIALVEQLTGKKVSYRNDQELRAYLSTLEKALPQAAYDRAGFLAALGLTGMRASGRTDRAVVEAVRKLPHYRPESEFMGKPIAAQQKIFDFAMRYPNVFLALTRVSNPIIEVKGRREKDWREALPTPQGAPLPSGVAPAEHYRAVVARREEAVANGQARPNVLRAMRWEHPATEAERMSWLGELIKRQVASHFGPDTHGGGPETQGAPASSVLVLGPGLATMPTKPDDPASHPAYGTYPVAQALGFSVDSAKRLGRMANGIDRNITPYGATRPVPLEKIDRHFNLDRNAQDSRLAYAARHLQAAIAYGEATDYAKAEIELGCGLHSLQDLFAHGQLSPSVHGILGQFPDDVDWNPIGFYEATQATAAYLNAYLDAILAPPTAASAPKPRIAKGPEP